MKKKVTASSDSGTTAPRRRRQRTVQYVLILLGCVVIVDALVGDRGLVAMMKARREYRTLEAALAHDRAENARMREEARRLREDPSAIEEVARRELGLIKPGEKLFIVKDVPKPDDPPQQP